MSYRVDIFTPSGWRPLAAGITHPTEVLDVVQGTIGPLLPGPYSWLWHALGSGALTSRYFDAEFAKVRIMKERS